MASRPAVLRGVPGVVDRAVGTSWARLAYGTVLAIWPGVLAWRTGDVRSDRIFSAVVRVLGVRHVVQALVLAAHPTRRLARFGAVADALHAATDVTCAVLDGQRAIAACTDAGVAIGFAVTAVTGSSNHSAARDAGGPVLTTLLQHDARRGLKR